MAEKRSPNYPGSSLGTALLDVRTLYTKEHRSPFVNDAGAKHLGYQSLSGPARRRLSALRQYGLLKSRPGGEYVLSDRALTLILRNEASSEYQQSLHEAAHEPLLFRELAASRLAASNESFKHYLIVNKRFTDEGAAQFIKVFRDTMALIGAEESGKMSGQQTESSDEEEEDMVAPTEQRRSVLVEQAVDPDTRTIPLPLSAGKTWVTLQGRFPLTPGEFDQLKALLDAMKPGLVAEPEK